MTDEEFDKLAQVAYPLWLECIDPAIEELDHSEDEMDLIDLFVAVCISREMEKWQTTSSRVIH